MNIEGRDTLERNTHNERDSFSALACGRTLRHTAVLLAVWGFSVGWTADSPGRPGAGARAIVAVETRGPKVRYSRLLFGGFLEHFHRQIYGGIFDPGSRLADERGFRKDVLGAVRELGTSVVRWPGGCFASGYHWKEGIGVQRRPVPDPVWGVLEPNTFGTGEFVQWCRRAGAAPYICTNAGNGTPEEMREWVEYCNAASGTWAARRAANGHPRPFNVRFWSIGNENWGAHEIGARRPAEWGPLVRRAAELMLSVDPDITLLAAATPSPRWTLPLLAAAGKHLEYICIHQYWLGFWQRNQMPDYLTCIMLSEGPEATITRVIDLLEKAGYRGRIKIAFDEWNLRGWHHPGFPRKRPSDPKDPEVAALIAKRDVNAIARQYTMADALFSASFLNACLRHAEDVGMANIAPLVNTRGPIFVHQRGIVKRTTFHVLAMYARELEERVATVSVEAGRLVQGRRSVAMVDAAATVDSSGKRWAVALVNRHPSAPVACTVELDGRGINGVFDAVILAGDSPEAYNDVEHPDRVAPKRTRLTVAGGVVTLPAHSLTIVKIVGTASR